MKIEGGERPKRELINRQGERKKKGVLVDGEAWLKGSGEKTERMVGNQGKATRERERKRERERERERGERGRERERETEIKRYRTQIKQHKPNLRVEKKQMEEGWEGEEEESVFVCICGGGGSCGVLTIQT